MGNYEVPVPEHWLLDEDSRTFTIVNSDAKSLRRDGQFQTTTVVTVFPFLGSPIGTSQMDLWLSLQRKWLERKGVKSAIERRLSLDGEPVICIGGRELGPMMRGEGTIPDTNVVSLDCVSANALNIAFIGEASDLQPFYTFVSQIRRHRDR